MSVTDRSWSVRSFGEFCRQHKLLNASAADLTPLSVTKSDGVIPQATKFKKRIAIADTTKYKVLRKGEFVYDPMSLYYGAIGWLQDVDQGIVSPAYITFDVDPTISPEFFWYLVKSERVQKEFVARTEGGNLHGKRKKTDWDAFCSVALPLPPLSEQRKIAGILGSVDEAIRATQMVIEQTRTVKHGLLQEFLTRGIGHTRFKQTEIGGIPDEWELKTVGEVVSFDGGSQPPRSTFVFEPRRDYVRLIQIRDYKTDKFATYIPRQLAKRFCTADDVMIGRYGPPIFQILRGVEGAYNVALIKASPSKRVLKNYLFHFLRQYPLFRLIDRLSQRSSGQTGVDMEALRSFPFPLPPLDEQHVIAEKLDHLEQVEGSSQRALEQLRAVRSGVLQDLLTGRVRVTAD